MNTEKVAQVCEAALVLQAVATRWAAQVPPLPAQLLFSVCRRGWNSNRSCRHLSSASSYGNQAGSAGTGGEAALPGLKLGKEA